jgi:outer membrane protein assembly factor BamD (BamD/ComL family)
MMADIYRDGLHKNDMAKKYYEQLIIDFPGSTFVQLARQKLREINEATTQ